MRYTAHTLDGSIVYKANTLQRIANAVAEHVQNERMPHIAYTYDNLPGCGLPYTTWVREGNRLVGTPQCNFDEVCEALGVPA